MITYFDLKLYYITFDNDDLSQVYTTYAFVWKIGTRRHPMAPRTSHFPVEQFRTPPISINIVT